MSTQFRIFFREFCGPPVYPSGKPTRLGAKSRTLYTAAHLETAVNPWLAVGLYTMTPDLKILVSGVRLPLCPLGKTKGFWRSGSEAGQGVSGNLSGNDDGPTRKAVVLVEPRGLVC